MIPVYNSLNTLQQCLKTIPGDVVLHVYDDGSDTETADFIRSLPGIWRLRNEHSRGYAHSINTFGLWCLQHNVTTAVVCNSDIVFSSTALSRLFELGDSLWGAWEPWETSPEAFFVGPALSHAKSGQLADPILKTIASDIESELDRMQAQRQSVKLPIKTVSGSCFGFCPKAFLKFGFFDECFGLGSAEEEEWMSRISDLENKWKGVYDSSICVWHWGHSSFRLLPNNQELWERNKKKMILKQTEKRNWEQIHHPRQVPMPSTS